MDGLFSVEGDRVVFYFYGISLFLFLLVGVLSYFWLPAVVLLVVLVPVFIAGLLDLHQTKRAILRNFPLIGKLRYFFEMIRPELQQYFVESNLSGRPIPREFRSIVYQRAKGAIETLPFGTQRDVYLQDYEWIAHGIAPVHVDESELRVRVGSSQCKKPYSSSLFNISAMSYGALSKAAIEALNKGAKKGRFSHNTGEGGVSSYHLKGGDLVWQIGTGYFGCRNQDGTFSESAFAERAQLESIKMIEIKISQGAKPGKGGILPGSKVTEEVAQVRLVPLGEDVISPPAHSTFSNPVELVEFIARLRELSGGKPVGFKICVGRKGEFFAICKAMVEKQIFADFISVDGSEGGTGAAPLEFSNSIGFPLEEGLVFIHDTLVGFGLRKEIKIIAAGKVFTSFHLLTKIALGADIVNSSRGMMLALGCIQALKCNTNECPAGVATTNPNLVRGLVVGDKAERVFRYHKATIHNVAEILGAMGYPQLNEFNRADVYRRLTDGRVATYEDLFPSVDEGSFLDEAELPPMKLSELRALRNSSALHF